MPGTCHLDVEYLFVSTFYPPLRPWRSTGVRYFAAWLPDDTLSPVSSLLCCNERIRAYYLLAPWTFNISPRPQSYRDRMHVLSPINSPIDCMCSGAQAG